MCLCLYDYIEPFFSNRPTYNLQAANPPNAISMKNIAIIEKKVIVSLRELKGIVFISLYCFLFVLFVFYFFEYFDWL